MTWPLLKYLLIPPEDSQEGRAQTWVHIYDDLFGFDLRDAVNKTRTRWTNGGRGIGIIVGGRPGPGPKEENGFLQNNGHSTPVMGMNAPSNGESLVKCVPSERR
jgi:hypothetical protein